MSAAAARDNQIMQGDKGRLRTRAFTAPLNLIKANKLITDLARDKNLGAEANLLPLLRLRQQIILFYYTKVTREINFGGPANKRKGPALRITSTY